MCTDNQSLWTTETELPEFPTLKKDVKTDVLIIGGGLTGLLCAHMLAEAGIEYILLEAGRICGGITKNTTAKITSQHGLIYGKLLKHFGEERTRQYLEANESAISQYRRLCAKVPCGFEEKDAFLYTTKPGMLAEELAALDRIGHPGTYVSSLPLPFSTAGAIRFSGQAQFQPLAFAAGIVKGLRIYEHSAVRRFDGHVYETARAKIFPSHVIVATHFPVFNKHGGYFLRLYQDRSYVLALDHAPDLNGMYMDADRKGFSFRNYSGRLLLGGGAHRTGKKSDGWSTLSDFAKAHYPAATECARWAAQDCMTLDGMPYIGRYAGSTLNLYVATGFNKWGMTSAMVAASILKDQILGKENAYADLFSPNRSSLRPQLAVNALEAVMNMLTPTVPRCPHMGCALKWNKQEHSWDCPCHGSRFGNNGKLLDGPATGRLRRP